METTLPMLRYSIRPFAFFCKVLVVLVTCGFPFAVSAGDVVLDDFKLWSTTYGEDTIRIFPASEAVVADGCNNPDSYMVKTSLTEPAKARIYSTLLAAKLANTGVKITTVGCQDDRPAIVNVILE